MTCLCFVSKGDLTCAMHPLRREHAEVVAICERDERRTERAVGSAAEFREFLHGGSGRAPSCARCCCAPQAHGQHATRTSVGAIATLPELRVPDLGWELPIDSGDCHVGVSSV